MAVMEEDMEEDMEEEEEEEEHHNPLASSSVIAGVVTGMVNDEMQEVMLGLSSKSEEELWSALVRMRKVLQSDSGGKMLVDYVIASPKCAELLNAWNSKSRTAVPTLLVLADLLAHPAGIRSAGGKLGVALRLDKFAGWIVQSKLSDVYSHLSSGQRSRENAALKLMSAIVRRGRLVAKQVIAKFDFGLEALRRLAKSKPTRAAFIEFAMSFLAVGDSALLRWVLQKRALYAGVLHGLGGDDDGTIVHVLDVFMHKVLQPGSSSIPQGIQVALFGDAALEQLHRITARENSDSSQAVALAHQVLLALCSDPKHGICSSSAVGHYGGGAGRLLRLMSKLKPAQSHLHTQLLLAIANSAPLLAAAYIDSFPYSLEPRSSSVWFSAMSLITSLVTIANVPNPFHEFMQNGLPPPSSETPVVQSSLRRIWPQTLSRALFNRALLHEDQLVKHSCLRLLLEVLAALERLLKFIQAAQEASSGFSEEWSKLGTYVQDKARIVLPDCDTLLSLHSSSKKQVGSKRKASDDRETGNHKRHKTSEASVSRNELNSIWGEDLLAIPGEDMESLLYAKLLDVFSAYQRILPLAMRDVNFDPLKFLPKDLRTFSLSQQQSLVSLLLSTVELTSSKLTASGNASPLYKHLKLLSRLVVSLKTVDVRQKAYALLYESLHSTGAFESNPYEVEIWLRCLPGWHNGSLESFDETVITFLCDGVLSVGRNLYKYVDQLHGLLSKHSMKGSESAPGGRTETEYEFGPLVVCALDIYKRLARPEAKGLKIPQKSSVAIYLGSVLQSLLHSQVSPHSLAVVISSMLSDCDMKYCEWNPLRHSYWHATAILDRTEMSFSIWFDSKHPRTLPELINLCRQQDTNFGGELAVSFARSLYCVHPAELVESFFELLEVHDAIFNGDFTALVCLIGAYPEILSEAAVASPAIFSDAAAHFICKQEEESCDESSNVLAALIRRLSFEVLFVAACFNQARLLSLPRLGDVLLKILSEVSGREVILCGRMILQGMSYLYERGLDQQLDGCFILLRNLMSRKQYPGELQQLVKDVFCHPIISMHFLSQEARVQDRLSWGAGPSMKFEELKELINLSIDLLHPLNRHVLRILEDLLLSTYTRSSVIQLCGRLTQRATEVFIEEVEKSFSVEEEMVLTPSLLLLSVLLPFAPDVDSLAICLQALSARLVGQEGRQVLSYQLVTFYLASMGFQKLQELSRGFVDDRVIDMFIGVVHLAMVSSLEIADFCLLLAMQLLASASILVAVTPAEVLYRSMQNTNQVRVQVVFHLVQGSLSRLADFGRFVAASSSGSDQQLPRDISYEAEKLAGFSISEGDLMLLLPVAELFFEKFETLEGCRKETLMQVSSIYGDLLAKCLLDWDSNVETWAEISEGAAESSSNCFARCILSKIANVLQLSTRVRPLSKKQNRRLLRRLLYKNNEKSLDPAPEDGSRSYDTRRVNKLAGKASVLKTFILGHSGDEGDLASELSAFIPRICTTLATVYKHCNNTEDILFLEEHLLAVLCEAMESLIAANPGLAYAFIRQLAKTLLRFRFGKPGAMEGLERVFVKLLQNLKVEDDAAEVEKVVTDVMDLVLAHSQLVHCLLVNEQASSAAVKGTALTGLPSVVSLLGKDGEVEFVSETRNLSEPEESKLRVLKLLRALLAFKLRFKDLKFGGLGSKDSRRELLSLLLASYGATLSFADQEIFCIMHEVEMLQGEEAAGVSEMDYLWGDAALARRKQESDKDEDGEELLEESLEDIRRRRFKEDLALDPRKCGMTALHFPTKREIWSSDMKDSECSIEIYDPAFLMPFAMHALCVGCIDSEEFVRLGLLAVSFSSMSSACEGLRKYGYELLTTYSNHLEESPSFKGKTQIQALLTYIKNAITQPWERIPSIICLFAAEASCILMHPDNPNYVTVNRFLLRSPSIDLKAIPLFQAMFTSGSPNSGSERAWMFKLLLAGLVSSADARIYRRQFVAEILMSFCTSSMADSHAQHWTLLVLKRAVTIPSFARYLLDNAGLPSWLASAAMNFEDSLSLQVLQLLIRKKGTELHLLEEGVEEVTKVASSLLQFVSTKRCEVLRKPAYEIVKSALRLSQRRNKYQSSFSLSWKRLIDIVASENSRGGDKFSALECILQSPPPPVCKKQDEETLCWMAKWIEPQLNSRFLRWCSAAVLLGTVLPNEKPSFTTWWSYFTFLRTGGRRFAWDLQLCRLIISLNSDAQAGNGETVATVNVLVVLISGLPEAAPADSESHWLPDELNEMLKVYLLQLPCPEELHSSWRWNRSCRQQFSSAERAVYRILLTLLQQFCCFPARHIMELISRWKRCLISTS